MAVEPQRVRALDGLRAAAVAAVLAFHLAPLGTGSRRGVLPGGWLGVDAFFTLSGFLITSLLLAELERGRIDLGRFWRRRIRRLQPAGLVAIAAIVATARWWSPSGTGTAVRGDALGALANVANWHLLWSHQPYAASGTPSAFEHFWSLAVEEQFYVLWPIALVCIAAIARRVGASARKAVLLGALVGIAASWSLLAYDSLQRGYLGADTRLGSILAGAALACVLPLRTERSAAPRGMWALAGASAVGILALWCVAGWPPHAPLAVLLPLHATCVVALITAIALDAEHAVARALGTAPVAAVGRVSYGIYLWHWPVFVWLTPERLGIGTVATDVVRLVVVALVTAASWVIVERPVRIGRALARTRIAYPVAAAATAAAILVGTSAVAAAPLWARAHGSLVRSTTKAASVTRAPGGAARVLVVGDSVPTSLLSTTDASGASLQMGEGRLLERLAAHGITAASATLTGCPVLDEAAIVHGEVRDYCEGMDTRAYERAFTSFRPDLVVWLATTDGAPVRLHDGRTDDPATSAAAFDALVARFAVRVGWFASHGARVVLVAPGPDRTGHDAADVRGDSVATAAVLDRALHTVARSRPREIVAVLDMSDLTCPSWRVTRRCADTMPGGGSWRPDGEHYGGRGAVAASVWLADRVAALHIG